MNGLKSTEVTRGIAELFKASGMEGFNVTASKIVLFKKRGKQEEKLNMTKMFNEGRIGDFVQEIDMDKVIASKDNLSPLAKMIVDRIDIESTLKQSVEALVLEVATLGPWPYVIEDGCDNIVSEFQSAGYTFTGVSAAKEKMTQAIYRASRHRSVNFNDVVAKERKQGTRVFSLQEENKPFVDMLTGLVSENIESAGVTLSHVDLAPQINKYRQENDVEAKQARENAAKLAAQKEVEAQQAKENEAKIADQNAAVAKAQQQKPTVDTAAQKAQELKARQERVAKAQAKKDAAQKVLEERQNEKTLANLGLMDDDEPSDNVKVSQEKPDQLSAKEIADKLFAAKKQAEPYRKDDAVPYKADFQTDPHTRTHLMKYLKAANADFSYQEVAELMGKDNVFLSASPADISLSTLNDDIDTTSLVLNDIVENIEYDLLLEDRTLTAAQMGSRIMKAMEDEGISMVMLHSPDLANTPQPYSLDEIDAPSTPEMAALRENTQSQQVHRIGGVRY